MTTKKRKRGTVSIPCPKCKGPTRVHRTSRVGGSTRRDRRCVRARCRGRVITLEAPAK